MNSKWSVQWMVVGWLGCVGLVLGDTPMDPPLPDPTGMDKVKFISMAFPPPSGETPSALRVRLVTLHNVVPPYSAAVTIPFTHFEGQSVWVGPPETYVESNASQIPFTAARTRCTPYYHDWNSISLLHVTGSHIVPSSIYAVERVPIGCQGTEDDCAETSVPLEIRTRRWTDVETPFAPPSATVQPDLADVSSVVGKFRSAPGAPIKARTLLMPFNPYGEISVSQLTNDVGFTSISATVDGFRCVRYPAQMGTCGIGECNSGDPDIEDALCVTVADCLAAGQFGPCSRGPACTNDADCGANGPCNLYCPD